jgi:hypothetical protein
MVVLVLAVGALVVAAVAADAIRHDTWKPVWEMAWLPGVVAAAMYRPSGRCRERA